MNNNLATINGLTDVNLDFIESEAIETTDLSTKTLKINGTDIFDLFSGSGSTTGFNQRINDLETEVANLETQVANLETADIAIENDIATLNTKVYSYKGAYSSATTYIINDMVRYNNALYYCIVNNTTEILPTVTNNWTLYLDAPPGPQGPQGIQGPKGDRGPAADDEDDGGSAFFSGMAGGIIGGIAGGAGAAGVSAFINSMKDAGFATLENLGDQLDNAYDEWSIQELKDKTQYQSATTLTPTTYFKSDVVVQDALLANKVLLKQDGKIDCTTIECANININNDLYVADDVTVIGDMSVSGSSITIGPSNQFGTVTINGYVSMPLMNNFFGFNTTNGFINQI